MAPRVFSWKEWRKPGAKRQGHRNSAAQIPIRVKMLALKNSSYLFIYYRERTLLLLLLLKVKVKLPPCFLLTEHHAMKAYWGLEI